MSWRAWRYQKKRRSTASKRYPGRNLHHLIPKSRGGPKIDWNLLLIRVERHELLHDIFGVPTPEEVIMMMQRLIRMKEHQRLNHLEQS